MLLHALGIKAFKDFQASPKDNLLGRIYDMSPQSHAFNKQSAWSEQMAKDAFDRESQYNSPAAQMQRYKDAGLNPHLIYGQSGSSSAGNTSASVPSAQHAAPGLPGGISMPDIFGMLMQVGSFIEDQKLKKAQRENLYSSATLTHQKDYSEQIRHGLLEQQFQHLLKMNPQIQKQQENLNKLAPYQLEGANINNQRTRVTIENLLKQGRLMDQDMPIKERILQSKTAEAKIAEAQASMTEHGITNPQQFMQFLLMALLKSFN